MVKEGNSKIFFFAMFALTALASIIIVFPFLSSILAGGLLAFVFYPFYEWVKRKVRYKSLAAFLIALLIVVIITVPTIVLVQNLATESQYLYVRTKQQLFAGQLIEDRCYDNTFLCRTVRNVNSLLREEETRAYLIGLLNDLVGAVTQRISNTIVSLPKVMLSLFVTLFTTYYLLTSGGAVVNRIARVIPLKVHHQEQVIQQFADVTYALIYGSFIVALVQGALGAFGFWIFGIKGFLWWGIVTTLFALVPFVGTGLVWVPMSMFLFVSGYVQGEPGLMWRGIGLFFYGLFIISTIDNILKPLVIAGRAKVHPLPVLLGVLGGFFMFGLIGLVVGPFVLTGLQKLFEIYERERSPHLDENGDCITGRHDHKHIKSKDKTPKRKPKKATRKRKARKKR